MMKRLLLTASIALSLISFAQEEASVWPLMMGPQVNFDGLNQASLTSTGVFEYAGNEGEAIASIADAEGHKLFYLLGDKLYDQNDTLFDSGFNSDQSNMQGSIILQNPGHERQYYLFTVDPDVAIYYAKIEVNASREISIISKNNVLATDEMMECLTIVPQAADSSFWLIAHGQGPTDGGSYYAYGIDKMGVSSIPVISTVGQMVNDYMDMGVPTPNVIGSLKSNSCYSKLALSNIVNGLVDVVDFDNNTGLVTGSSTQLDAFSASDVYSIEFSPNGRFLYVTENSSRQLLRFDLEAVNVQASKSSLGQITTARAGQLQLGNDGKVYFACHNWGSGGYIGVINAPNEDVNPDVNLEYLTPNPVMGELISMGLPNFPRHLVSNILRMETAESSSCEGAEAEFSVELDYQLTIANSWLINSDAFGPSSTLSHAFNDPGTHLITANVTDNCGRSRVESISYEVDNSVYSMVDYADPFADRCPSSLVEITALTDHEIGSHFWYDSEVSEVPSAVDETIGYVGDLPHVVWVEPAGKLVSSLGGDSPAGTPAPNDIYTKIEFTEPVKLSSFDFQTYSWGICGSGYLSFEIRKTAVDGVLVLKDSVLVSSICGKQSVELEAPILLSKGIYYVIYKSMSAPGSLDRGVNYNGPYVDSENIILVYGYDVFSWNHENGPFFNFTARKLIECAARRSFVVTQQCVTATERKLSNVDFAAHPNPSNSQFQVLNDRLEIDFIEVYNVSGEKVLELSLAGLGQANFGENLESGIYLVHVYTESGVQTERVVKD